MYVLKAMNLKKNEKKKAIFLKIVAFKSLLFSSLTLIVVEGARLLARTGGQVRHLKVKRTNVAHRLPRGKRASATEIKNCQK
jgi:hypothetical protein